MQVLGNEGHTGSFWAARVTVQCVCLFSAALHDLQAGGGNGPDFGGSHATYITQPMGKKKRRSRGSVGKS
ncbi:hypothetical protein E2C01_021775 [Portunus trituberculatus]|uniref:Uncharacterized protein n=1 Tax=Portunus trituberculatus TaxID=210409 RepID=A0A5B7E5G0_PORTR|nr:hypothetical protein [Portunus trituberculatus]